MMPTIRTYASPVDDYVKVKIPDAYRSCSFEVLLVPVEKARREPSVDEAIANMREKVMASEFEEPSMDEINAFISSVRAARRQDRVAA